MFRCSNQHSATDLAGVFADLIMSIASSVAFLLVRSFFRRRISFMNLKHKINVKELPTPHCVYTLSLVAKILIGMIGFTMKFFITHQLSLFGVKNNKTKLKNSNLTCFIKGSISAMVILLVVRALINPKTDFCYELNSFVCPIFIRQNKHSTIPVTLSGNDCVLTFYLHLELFWICKEIHKILLLYFSVHILENILRWVNWVTLCCTVDTEWTSNITLVTIMDEFNLNGMIVSGEKGGLCFNDLNTSKLNHVYIKYQFKQLVYVLSFYG
ncbi:hypothetical protein AGLY_012449 [Aphis glycines]|uniref:Uncharacterized protein n=1 Tax=Aphis glycines TaxID=307491 RepID=A0A6G0TCB2_APHGL|nr:hypothetical protein AGLY_012449 [Aphis glycines]